MNTDKMTVIGAGVFFCFAAMLAAIMSLWLLAAVLVGGTAAVLAQYCGGNR